MDFNNIPPVPPPPTLKHHASKLGLQFLQHQQQQQQQQQQQMLLQQKQKTIDASRNYNGRNSTSLCSNDVGSLLDDCTASILKCANTFSDELGFSTNPSVTGKAVLANTTKENTKSTFHNQIGIQPDTLKDLNEYWKISGRNSHDDIIMPKSEKYDLNLCFLHAKSNGLGIRSGIGSTGTALNIEPDLHIDINSRRNFNKYNTIGPSSVYAKHWSAYSKELQENKTKEREREVGEEEDQNHTIGTSQCRCFCKSLSSFPMRSYNDNGHTEFTELNSADNQHAFNNNNNVENKPPSYPPIIGNSFTNLVSNDAQQRPLTKTNRFHVPTNVFNTSCNYKVAPKSTINLLNEASFLTSNRLTDSGLNHYHQQHQHHNHQTNVYQKNSPHPNRKQNHQHEHSEIQRHYTQQDYMLHNSKANVLGLHNQITIRNHHDHHQHHYHHQQAQQQSQQDRRHHQHEFQQQTLQEKHLSLQSNVTNLMPWKHRQCPSRCSSSSGTNSLRK